MDGALIVYMPRAPVSVRGIEAVMTGFFPTPSRAVVKLAKSQQRFFTIAQVLKKQGYHTQFIYGGESHFDNMKSFLLGNGIMDIVDLPRFKNPKFVGSWGASDQDLYIEAHQQFSQLHQQGKRFMSLVFTSSNHTPYDFPENQIELYEQPKATRHNAIKYSDHALGEFFTKAKSSAYWQDTIFLVIADHDANTQSYQSVPVEHFHIPGVIIGNGITAQKDQRIVSNIDMPPTLLSLAGINYTSPMLGHDLNRPIAQNQQRAMMQFAQHFGFLDHQGLVVLMPNQQVKGFDFTPPNHYQPKTLSAIQIEKAKAHALLGNWLYQANLYAWPP